MDRASLGAAGRDVAALPIRIDDTSGLTLVQLRAKAKRMQTWFRRRGEELGLLVIDYLQLMQGPNVKGQNRENVISEISRGLKVLAKELDVPIIALSQLNRSLESRTDKRPMPSDLRESGAIEQDADVILFIYRDEVYHDDSPKKGIAEVIIAKQRGGAIGTVEMAFLDRYVLFQSLSRPGEGYV
jgi:replicative DNA helicase